MGFSDSNFGTFGRYLLTYESDLKSSPLVDFSRNPLVGAVLVELADHLIYFDEKWICHLHCSMLLFCIAGQFITRYMNMILKGRILDVFCTKFSMGLRAYIVVLLDTIYVVQVPLYLRKNLFVLWFSVNDYECCFTRIFCPTKY